jgi:hypothetical protein
VATTPRLILLGATHVLGHELDVRGRRRHGPLVEDGVLAADGADRGELVDRSASAINDGIGSKGTPGEGDVQSAHDHDGASCRERLDHGHQLGAGEMRLADRDDLGVVVDGASGLLGPRDVARGILEPDVRGDAPRPADTPSGLGGDLPPSTNGRKGGRFPLTES